MLPSWTHYFPFECNVPTLAKALCKDFSIINKGWRYFFSMAFGQRT
uniref:Uncharacterized protein n=1 Tax=Arundo donax TaxID=35708 RepID=A0A0A9FSH9_ARUDO